VAKTDIGKLNRRTTFENATYTQDAGGGSLRQVTESWLAWAEIIDTSGNSFNAFAQTQARADYRVKVRFDSRFNSNTMMIYEGQYCKCENIDVESEGYKGFWIMRFSKTDTWVNLS